MKEVLYNWKSSLQVSDWKLEGMGEIEIAESKNNSLLVRTFHCGPGRKAMNIWLKELDLPNQFEVEWTFWSRSGAGKTMILFNAVPLGLQDFFEDPRSDARYCDLASYRKMVCHTLGFHRGTYNKKSVLRKLGGNVPEYWGQVAPGSHEWKEMDHITELNTASEPLEPEDKGKLHYFLLRRVDDRIRFWVNNSLVHDFTDSGQYPYFSDLLQGGKLGFRNFSGYAEDFYPTIEVRKI